MKVRRILFHYLMGILPCGQLNKIQAIWHSHARLGDIHDQFWKSGIVAYTYDSSSWEVEAERNTRSKSA